MKDKKFIAYRIRIFADQTSQLVKMASTQAISYVVVTGNTTVGLSTPITRIIASQFICQKPKSPAYGTENFITTCSLGLPVSCVHRFARMGAPHSVYPEPVLGWLSDYLPPSYNKCPSCVQIMVLVGIRVTKATTNPQIQ